MCVYASLSVKSNIKKIIAIIGLPGSGKTEVINYLIKKFGWPKVYFGDVTFDEMKKRRLEINEKNERTIREELREKYGMGAYAVFSLPKIEKFLESNDVVLLESLYSWEEYLEVKNKFGDKFKVIAIYAPPGIRYKRLSGRPERPLTSEEAESRDHAQIENLHQAGPIAMANYTITNDKDINHLYSQVDDVIIKYKK